MTPRFGIDTSLLLRLVTGRPSTAHRKMVERLVSIAEETDASVRASNHVIAETYLALRHHFHASHDVACEGIRSVLTSGLVSPVGGNRVDRMLARTQDRLVDRLVINGYGMRGLRTLTQDAFIAQLPGAFRLHYIIDPVDSNALVPPME
jgi:predicted nucleic acid-binding protein